MNPPPQDFTSREWTASATPLHTFYVIREGVHGTAMPRWPNLTDDEIWDLVNYVLSVSKNGP